MVIKVKKVSSVLVLVCYYGIFNHRKWLSFMSLLGVLSRFDTCTFYLFIYLFICVFIYLF